MRKWRPIGPLIATATGGCRRWCGRASCRSRASPRMSSRSSSRMHNGWSQAPLYRNYSSMVIPEQAFPDGCAKFAEPCPTKARSPSRACITSKRTRPRRSARRSEHLCSAFAPSSQRAGAEAGDDVVAVRREEVAVARARDPRAGGEASPAQHLARIEPGLRIVFVRVRGEAGKRHEIRGRPFPQVADHLPAAEGAVAWGASGDIDRSFEGEIEVGAVAARRRLAPRPAALAIG